MKTNLIRRLSALALALFLCAQAMAPAALAAEDGTVYIRTAEDLAALSEKCALDAWSRDKTVILAADVSLASVDFLPIPTFGGTFDGGGHTISGLSVTGRLSPAGLFGVLQEGAAVRDLTVSGTVAPAGSGGSVGGVAGENRGLISNCAFSGSVAGQSGVGGIAGINGPTGRVGNCSFSGGVTGSSRTGGIVGENRGVAASCRNRGYVNITSADPGLDLSEVELSAQLLTLRSLDAVNIATDTGGVAGLSSGMLLSCVNEGLVGYRHVGYNVGGIAGRSSGFVSGCTNLGRVFGRKDIGGVVGQAEPYVRLDLSEDTLSAVRAQLDRLEELVDRTANDAQSVSADLSGRFTAVNDALDDAADRARTLSDRLSGYGGDITAELDRGGDLLSDALDRLDRAAEDAGGLSELLAGGLEGLERAVRELADAGDYAEDAAEDLKAAAEELTAAGRLLDAGMKRLRDGFRILAGAVKVQDTAGAQRGLDDLLAGVSQLSRAAGELTAAMDHLADAAGKQDRDELEAAFQEASAALSEMRPAFDGISGGLTALRGNVTFDLSAARSGLALIRQGMDLLAGTGGQAGVSGRLARALDHLKAAVTDAGPAAGRIRDALDGMAGAAGDLSDASDRAGDALDGVADVVRLLAGADPIQIASPDQVLGDASDGLFDALSLLGVRLDALNAGAAGSADTLTADLRAVNAQFGALTDTLLDAAGDLEDGAGGDKFSDTSGEDIDAVVSGKLRGCVNQGDVSGDLCVGGVAGSMAVEYELDPEDDALNADAPAYRRAYELKAILQDCVNTGAVSARRNYAGSVCGRISLGLALDCGAYGTVESESGDYVGGVAGFSAGAVRSCWSKCTLSGGKYVGGVVGAAGVEGGRDGDGGVVAGCVSFVRIAECQQYAGAVSGAEYGAFRDNRFVERTGLAGLGRVSLAGQAEPASYETLTEDPGLPAAFRRLTLRFLADGQVVKTVGFRYGDSFDDSVYPEPPAKEGQYAQWDVTDLTDLRFDTDVTAVYAPCRTALASRERRSDGRPVLFVEGRFSGGDALTLESASPVRPAGNTPVSLRRAVEGWTLSIPEDGGESHTLRYLSPNGSADGLEVYTLENGVWERLPAKSVGSYLVFEAQGARPALAVVSRTAVWWVWPLALAVLAALFPLARQLFLRLRKKRAPRPAAPAGEDVPAETARSDGGDGDRRQKRRRVLTVFLVLVCVLAALVSYLFFTGGLDSAAAAEALYRYVRQDAFAMDLSLRAELGDRRMGANTELIRTRIEDADVAVARQLGVSLYYSGGTVYLDSGAAFQLGGGLPDYGDLLGTVILLYRAGDIQVFRNGGETIYSLRAEGVDAQSILTGLLPGAEELAALERIDIDLVVRSGALAALRFTADGVLRPDGPASLSAVFTARESWETPEVPSAVREAILSGGDGQAQRNTEDLLRLLTAWGRLNLTDPLSARLSLSADCGPLMLSDELELLRTWEEGRQVGCVRKGGRALYFSNGRVYTGTGASAETGGSDGDPAAREAMLELACALSLRGEASCVQQDGGYLYSLRLGPEDMAQLAAAILPAVRTLDVAYTEGVLELTVSEGDITALRMECGGTLQVLTLNVPVSLSCGAQFAPAPDFALPDGVADAIRREPD